MNKTPRSSTRHHAVRPPLGAAAAVALMFLAACASTPAPTAEMAVSAAAVDHALAAGGATLAPADMRSASDKLARAKAAMAAEDYALARSLAQQAQADAQLAEAKTHAAKARKAADEVAEADRVLRVELERKTK
jgi:hypothetical protein